METAAHLCITPDVSAWGGQSVWSWWKRLYSVGSHPTAGDTQAHIRVAVLIYKRLIINYHLVEMFRSL